MYRLFCYNRTLVAKYFSEDVFSNDDDNSKCSNELVDSIKHWLEDDSVKCLDLGDTDGDSVALALKTVFRQAPAAGGVVMIDNQFVAIERKGIADLPKGHIEKGETPEVAALREVEEETGIKNLEIIKELPATWHCYLVDNEWTIKKNSWFLMRTSTGMNFVPQTEEGITKVYLVGKDDVNEFVKNTWESLIPLIETLDFRP